MPVNFNCYSCGATLTLGTPQAEVCPHCHTQLTNRYKCHTCHIIIHADDLIDDRCPVCSGAVVEVCVLDHCRCPHDIVESLTYCPICGAAVCPACLCHDVSQVSRITGYMSEVGSPTGGGWNEAKKQELKDRVRYNVGAKP